MGHRKMYFVPQSEDARKFMISLEFEQVNKDCFKQGDKEVRFIGNKVYMINHTEEKYNMIRDMFRVVTLFTFAKTGKLPYPPAAIDYNLVKIPE